MISHSLKFVFIHVPKTGGSAIETALLPICEDKKFIKPRQDGTHLFQLRVAGQDALNKHSTLSTYYDCYGDRISSYLKVATLRNPFSELVSWYFSPHRRYTEWSPERFEKHILERPVLEHYVLAPMKNAPLDHFMRFETLQQDFEDLCGKIGWPATHLEQINVGPEKSYRDYYTAKTRAMVEERFAFEIDLGGYEF